MLLTPRWREIGSEIGAFLLAASCAGCGTPGVLLCVGCRAALAPTPVLLSSPGGLRIRAAMPFDGVAARCIRRVKGEGETLLVRPLAEALATVLRAELDDETHPVPIPTSRAAFRRRGYRVPDLLIAATGVRGFPALRHTGRSLDQRGLSAGERAANVRDSMRARVRGDGARVVVVDDVVTTGATIDEASRALREAGFEVVAGVALAATERHSIPRGNAPATRRK